MSFRPKLDAYKFKLSAAWLLLVCVNYQVHKAFVSLDAFTLKSAPSIPACNDNIRVFSLGYEQVLADIYWLTFVQYVGDYGTRCIDHYRDADRYVEKITLLDPSFFRAYFFGLFLIGGEQRSPEKFAKIVKRGIADNPKSWYLLYLAGLNEFLYAHDDIQASRYFCAAADRKFSPNWLRHLGTVLESRAPSFAKQIVFWEHVYQTSPSALIKRRAKENLVELWRRVLISGDPALREKANAQLNLIQNDFQTR